MLIFIFLLWKNCF